MGMTTMEEGSGGIKGAVARLPRQLCSLASAQPAAALTYALLLGGYAALGCLRTDAAQYVGIHPIDPRPGVRPTPPRAPRPALR